MTSLGCLLNLLQMQMEKGIVEAKHEEQMNERHVILVTVRWGLWCGGLYAVTEDEVEHGQ